MRLVLPACAVPGVVVEASPMTRRSFDEPARALETVDGWPLALVRTAGTLRASYAFGDYGAHAIARGAVDEHVAELTALFVAGRPDFTADGIVALADAWAGLEEA